MALFEQGETIIVAEQAWDMLLEESSPKTPKQREFIEGVKKIVVSGNSVCNEKGRILDRLGNCENHSDGISSSRCQSFAGIYLVHI